VRQNLGGGSVLTERESLIIKHTVKDIAAYRKSAINEAMVTFGCGTESQLAERFGPETFGSHEAGHAAMMLSESWEQYVIGSPAVALNEEAYRLASIAASLMAEVYNIIMTAEKDTQP
jgi:hypothetical protein